MRGSRVLVLAAVAAAGGTFWAGCEPAPREAEVGEPAGQETKPEMAVPEVRTWDEWVSVLSQEGRAPVRLEVLDESIPVTVRLDPGLEVRISGLVLRADAPEIAGQQRYLQEQLDLRPQFFGDSERMMRDSLTNARVYLNVDGRPVGLAYWPAHEGKLIRVHVDVIRNAAGERRVVVLGDYARIVSRPALFDQAKRCCESAPTVCGASPSCP